MRRLERGIGTILLIFAFSNTIGQHVDPREAREHFKNQNYLAAIPVYEKCIKQDAENIEYYIEISQCFMRVNDDKTRAIAYLERAQSLDGGNKVVLEHLAMAYMYALRYEDAKTLLEALPSSAIIDKMIIDCDFAVEAMKSPVDVTFTNAGDNINSEYPDYYPFVSKDDQRVVFTSRRKGSKGKLEFDGYYPADIFMSNKEDDGWKPSVNKFTFNSAYDEIAVGISDDGTQLYIYIDNYVDKIEGDIFLSEIKNNKWPRATELGENVNSKDTEISCSVSSDGTILFFTSDRAGGRGGMDLYMTRLLPGDLGWGPAQPVGDNINTIGNEDFPTLSFDGKTLYFASNGLPGMGGYDIYKTEWNGEQNVWSEPENLGYPINGPEDNKVISFTEDMRHAYVSMWRVDSKGDLDIYRLTYNDVEASYATFMAQVYSGDSLNPIAQNAYISVEDQDFNLVADFFGNPNTGTVLMALQPGTYNLLIEADGVAMFEKEFTVMEFHTELPMVDVIFAPPE